ncbi:MAG: hypothetical protein LQ351_001208 [Letrouitia transgressa]|nr:MAG: hypothetical protein LQ351_001208 [Letrouitia transgressa]
MVSQQSHSDHALARRAPSAASRSTTTRRHRSNRSHSGGSSFRPQNEFPNFAQTGDVEIVISAYGQEKRYVLHRLILAQCSGVFEAGTSEDWSRAQAQGYAPINTPTSMIGNGLARIGEEDEHGSGIPRPPLPGSPSQHGRCKWRYELDWGNKDDEVPMLVQKPATSTLFGGNSDQINQEISPVPNKPSSSSNSFFRSLSNKSAMQSAAQLPHASPDSDLHRDYDNLFRIFYNYPPHFDAANIAESYIECKSLLTLADMYDALEVVGPRIDHHLLQFQSRLWKQIAKYPPSYLKLGYLARSKVIFGEALVHVVGQWPSGKGQLRNMPDAVMELIEDKVEDLAEKKVAAEGKLFRLTLTTARGERVSPSNAYLDWLALSLFRQWLVENTAPPPPLPPKPPNGGNSTRDSPRTDRPPPIPSGHFYRLLFLGGSAYLPHDELKRFLKLRPGAVVEGDGGQREFREQLKKFERRMDEVKALAREVVRPLMRSWLELEGARDGGLGYLVCVRCEDGEWPWE